MFQKSAPLIVTLALLACCANLRAHGAAVGAPLIELETVVVTGTRTERLVSEAPVKTEVLFTADLEAYNALSFRDALRFIPTARFESDCQNCGVNQIQLMGLDTAYTAVLFDGAPLYSGLAKVYGADLFPAIFIDRIEVVKGGGSVLYGPEAIAGVVNLITAEPVRTRLRTTVGGESIRGDVGEWEVSLRADTVDPAGRFSASLYAMTRDRTGLDLGSDGFTEIPEFSNRVIGMQGWWHPRQGATLKVGYQFMDQAHRGGDRLDLAEEQARIAESLAHTVHLAQLSWRQRVSPGFDYSLGGSYLYLRRQSYYGARGDNEQRAYEQAGFAGDVTDAFILANQAAIDGVARNVWGLTRNHVAYLDSQFNHHGEGHIVSYGVQYRFEDLADGSLHDQANTPVSKDDFSNFGAFLQDQWAVTGKLELVPGIRVDNHDNVDGVVVSPRLAARLHASDEWTLRASWSTGFNAPGAFNEDKHIGVNNGGAIFLVNEPGLQEERSQTFSLGGEYQPHALNRQLILHSQIHHTHLKDSFEIDDSGTVSGDPNLWLRINGPDASVWVWENNLSWRVARHLRLDAGVSFIRARLDEAVARATGLITDELIKRPEWTGHVGLAYENPNRFNAHALYNYTGSMLAVGTDADIWRRTDPFHELDIGISRSFSGVLGTNRLTVSAGIANLFDSRQKDFQDNGEERDPTYLYGPTQPRTFYLRLSAEW